MRCPWPEAFPPLYVHAAWEAPADSVLPDHPSYWPAKKKRDEQAALRVCHDLVREEVLNLIFDASQGRQGEPPPMVVAPAMSLLESQNERRFTRAFLCLLAAANDTKPEQARGEEREARGLGHSRIDEVEGDSCRRGPVVPSVEATPADGVECG